MPSSADAVRHAARVEVELTRGLTVALETRDFAMLYLDGVIELPLLQGLQRVLAQEHLLNAMGAEAVEALTTEEMQVTVAILRRFACAIVVEPVFVMETDGNPDHADVHALQMRDLMAIWKAGRQAIGLKEVKAAVADRFRRDGGPTPRTAVPAREDFRPATKPVVRAGA